MKRIVSIILIIAMAAMLFAGGSSDSSYEVQRDNTRTTTEALADSNAQALRAVPIPKISYFTERQTIARWYERWDKPSVVTYVYLISYGNILGYYVCNGKPASIQSYLIPETHYEGGHDLGDFYGEVPVETADIDGTYGTLNYGIRFFTAEGTAVEWGGMGATYLYSDAPLPINVPKLNAVAN